MRQAYSKHRSRDGESEGGGQPELEMSWAAGRQCDSCVDSSEGCRPSGGTADLHRRTNACRGTRTLWWLSLLICGAAVDLSRQTCSCGLLHATSRPEANLETMQCRAGTQKKKKHSG